VVPNPRRKAQARGLDDRGIENNNARLRNDGDHIGDGVTWRRNQFDQRRFIDCRSNNDTAQERRDVDSVQ
jgi:hypothetical protein